MPSETDLLNDALGQIGATKINAIDDGSTNANYCLIFYPPLLDSLLRSHHWNFAMKRVELPQDGTTPPFEYAFSYTLPADYLKVVVYSGSNPDTTTIVLLETVQEFKWKIEGRKLLTNDGQVFIVYVARITDPNIWDGIFYQLISTWLASKLASAITKDTKKARELLAIAVDVLNPLATAVDGQEGSTDTFQTPELLLGR